MTSNIVLSNKEFKVVGKRPIRHDGYDKVTGKALYGADISPPGLLHGKIVRSPHAHARIISIDTSKAEAHPEVRSIATSADLVDTDSTVLGDRQGSQKILAKDKVLYKGHAVAAVAATSLHAAEEAAALIEVEYEVLPLVNDVEEAMKPGAPQLHDEYENNIADHLQLKLGDVEVGFDQADVIIDREFRTKMVHQGYIEPHSATAWWTPQDKITLWCSSQGHFQIGESTAKMVGVPVSQIRVVPMEIGGGFGGKTTVYVEPVAVVLSHKSGLPVKITMSRADVMEATGPTSGTYIKLKMGVTKDGRITAAETKMYYEAGAYPGSAVGAGAQCMLSPYDIANVLIDGYDIAGGGIVGMIAMMIIAPIAAALIQMAISRSREYQADATGAEMCGNPLWLASALKKLEVQAQRVPMAAATPATAHMFIVSPLRGGGTARLFSTHPPMAERVARLEKMAYGAIG